MARAPKEEKIQTSVLDRLLDDHPNLTQEPSSMQVQTLRQLKAAVSRDIEGLLNTRKELLEELPAEYKEVNNSILNYGLPDFTSFSLLNLKDKARIRRAIEQTILTFEPRLKLVRVVMEGERGFLQTMNFRIEGQLQIDPVPEPVSFDAVLQLMTSDYQVKGPD